MDDGSGSFDLFFYLVLQPMPGDKLGGGDDLNAEGFDHAEEALVTASLCQ